MKIIEQYLTNNQCFINGTRLNIKGLMLHSVGVPQPSAAVFIRNWNNPDVRVCVHGFIQADGNVYQTLPWNYVGWHGGGSSNNTHIGVEMTEPLTIKYTGGASFVDYDPEATKAHVKATYDTAVELFAHLCRKFDLNPATDIISHAEGHKLGIASNHADPTHLWIRYPELGLSMDGFRRVVKKEIEKEKNETVPVRIDEPSEWAKEATAWAKQKGIFVGDGNGRFRWRDSITREEVAQTLYNLYTKGKNDDNNINIP